MTKVLPINSFLNRSLPKFFSALAVAGALYTVQPAVAKTVENNKGANAELMSNPASEGIRAMTSPQVQQVPTEHSKQVHENLMKLTVSNEERDAVSAYENEIYSKYGSYAGAAILQNTIVSNAIYTFLNREVETIKKVNPELGTEMENNSIFFGTAPEHKEEIMDYVNSIANYVQNTLTSSNKKLTEQETIDKLYQVYKEMGLSERTIKATKLDYDCTKQDTMQEKMDNIASAASYLYERAIEGSYNKYLGEVYQGAGVGRLLIFLCPETIFLGFK